MTVDKHLRQSPNRPAAVAAAISAGIALKDPFRLGSDSARNFRPATHGPRASTKYAFSLANTRQRVNEPAGLATRRGKVIHLCPRRPGNAEAALVCVE